MTGLNSRPNQVDWLYCFSYDYLQVSHLTVNLIKSFESCGFLECSGSYWRAQGKFDASLNSTQLLSLHWHLWLRLSNCRERRSLWPGSESSSSEMIFSASISTPVARLCRRQLKQFHIWSLIFASWSSRPSFKDSRCQSQSPQLSAYETSSSS